MLPLQGKKFLKKAFFGYIGKKLKAKKTQYSSLIPKKSALFFIKNRVEAVSFGTLQASLLFWWDTQVFNLFYIAYLYIVITLIGTKNDKV